MLNNTIIKFNNLKNEIIKNKILEVIYYNILKIIRDDNEFKK